MSIVFPSPPPSSKKSIDFILIHSLIRFTSVALCFLSLSVTFQFVLFIGKKRRKKTFFDLTNLIIKRRRSDSSSDSKNNLCSFMCKSQLKRQEFPEISWAHILCTDGRTKRKSKKWIAQKSASLTNGSVVRSKSFGPRMAGAKKRRKMKPDTTEYRTYRFQLKVN